MRVTGLELIEVQLPLATDFETAAGTRRLRRILLVRAESEDGGTGWGECVAGEDPTYTYETTDTARHVLTDYLLPSLPGSEFLGPEEIGAAFGRVRGHPMAKAAVEMAFWDLQAVELGLSLRELLGGSPDPLLVGVVVGYQPDRDALLARVGELLDHGYARIKLKIGPGRDVDVVRAVRERFPGAVLTVDAGGSYTRNDIPHLVDLGQFDLQMIEQPLPPTDLLGHAMLQRKSDTNICLDESICGLDDALVALELEACRIINVKPGRVGGLTAARGIERLCVERGVSAWVGGMLETGIGRAHNLALAALPGFDLPGDLSESRRYWSTDIVEPEFTLEGGRMPVPDGLGIGVTVDETAIAAAAVDRRVFGRMRS